MENLNPSLSNSTNTSSATIRHELIGQTIAEKYKITRLLGRGGMGAVYEGQHLLLEKQIAVKVMSAELAEDKSALSRFIREAKTAAKLEHPNAVTIHDFGIWQDTTAYIVMEYINGISLRDWLSKNKVVPPLQTIKWLLQVCNAVAAAHECGIIHRDLKPENIMLKESGTSDPLIKVVDFGLAKVIKDEEASTNNLTKTGEVFGTPYYMGPEFYDNEVVDHRADIYALGIITYEMLSGRPPFYGTIEKIIAAHLFQEAKPLATVTGNSELEAFDKLIAMSLKKKKDERLSSAGEFIKELRNILANNSFSITEQEAKTLYSAEIIPVPTSVQKIDATTASQVLTIASNDSSNINIEAQNLGKASIPPTSKMVSGQVEKLESETSMKTLQGNLPTTKMTTSEQILVDSNPTNTLSNTNLEKNQFPTQLNQPSSSSIKKVPIAIGTAALVILGIGGTWYGLRNQTSNANPINNPISAPSTNNKSSNPAKIETKPVVEPLPDTTNEENKDEANKDKNDDNAAKAEDSQAKDNDKKRFIKKDNQTKRQNEKIAKEKKDNKGVKGFVKKIFGIK